MQKILLDTDIGSDIDDAVCLAYLLRHPECELLGITTVSSHPVERAMMVDVICRTAGRDIPIYPGIAEPLYAPQLQPRAQQTVKLSNWEHRTDFESGKAIEFLNKTIRSHPGEIILMPVGPLTNIALLFKLYPDIPSLLKGVVLMGGAFFNEAKEYRPLGEWNVRCDPHAAGIVYKAKPPYLRSVGLDACMHVLCDINYFKSKLTSEILKVVADFAEVWFAERPEMGFCDPIAAACIFNSNICEFEKGKITVEYKGENTGITNFEYDPNECHEVASKINKEAFFDELFRITG